MNDCYDIYEKSGFGAVIDHVNQQLENKNPDYAKFYFKATTKIVAFLFGTFGEYLYL